MNWDDLRILLAVARESTVRGAAAQLGLSHSTVIRRLERLETALGARLFVRTPRGLRPTRAGQTLLDKAGGVEIAMAGIRRAVREEDEALVGDIRLTMPAAVLTRLFMPDLARFCREHPGVRLRVDPSDTIRDLDRHEADVALLFVRLGKSPPDRLVGRRLGANANACYATAEYAATHTFVGDAPTGRWIGWVMDSPVPSWVPARLYPTMSAQTALPDLFLQLEAARAGLGVTFVPCALGDTTPELVRIPGSEPVDTFDIWLLTHPDLRDSARLRVFRDYLYDAMCAKLPLFAGHRPDGIEESNEAHR